MRGFLALLRREYLEHRVGFLYVPIGLLALFVVVAASALLTHHAELQLGAGLATPAKLFFFLYFVAGFVWWWYLALLLFYYYADAFHADARNNALLFWKSLPVSDLGILLGKFVAGLTLMPLTIYLAALVAGLVLVGVTAVLPQFVVGLAVPPLPELFAGWAELSVVMLVYLALALLWFSPFFAWVGGLSTVVGRWAIPLALLLPVGLSLAEGVVDFSTAPGGGYLLGYLRYRADFRYDSPPLLDILLKPGPLDAAETIRSLPGGL